MHPKLEVVLEARDAFLVLELRGKYNFSTLRKTIEEVGRRCRETGCRCILADARGHVGGIGLLDQQHIGEKIAREIPRGYHVAVVVSEARLAMDRHLETVAVNRGVPFRLFTDLEEANRWLMSSK